MLLAARAANGGSFVLTMMDEGADDGASRASADGIVCLRKGADLSMRSADTRVRRRGPSTHRPRRRVRLALGMPGDSWNGRNRHGRRQLRPLLE